MGPPRKSNRVFTDEDLLQMLRSCAEDLGRTPGIRVFNRWCGVARSQLVVRRFGSWICACEKAGLAPNTQYDTYYEQDCLEAYRRIKAVCPRVTLQVYAHLRHSDEPSEMTMRRRYGSWPAFCSEMEKQIERS